jgi:hypothetical protein
MYPCTCADSLLQQLQQQPAVEQDATEVQQAVEYSTTDLASQQQQQQIQQQQQQPAAVQHDEVQHTVDSDSSGNDAPPAAVAADVSHSAAAVTATAVTAAVTTDATDTADDTIADDDDVEATLDAHAAALADVILLEVLDEAVYNTARDVVFKENSTLLRCWIQGPVVAEKLLQAVQEPTVQQVLRQLQQYYKAAVERGDTLKAAEAQYSLQQLHTAITVCSERALLVSLAELVWPPSDSSVLCEWQQLLQVSAQLSSEMLKQVKLSL